MEPNARSPNGCLQLTVTLVTVGSVPERPEEVRMSEATLAGKRRRILEFIAERIRDRGYPPSVREIGEAVGLTSSSTVHAHLKVLQREGYLERDAEKPRAIVVNFEPSTGAVMRVRPAVHVPLVGRRGGRHRGSRRGVGGRGPPAPGSTSPGSGELFMLRVRGDSMIEAGILADDYVVVRRQPERRAGRDRRRRHPRRGGDSQDLQAPARQGGPRAGQRPALRDGVPPRRRHDLRSGGDGAASPVRPHRPGSADAD